MKKYTWIGLTYIGMFVFLALFLKGAIDSVNREGTGVVKEVRETKGKEKKVKKTDRHIVVKGNISKGITPFIYKTSADRYMLNMCYGNLIDTEDSKSICKSITTSYDEKNNITSYKIVLRNDIRTSSGTAITADDILFNYYLRCDTDYNGSDKVNTVPIVGLKSYQYGSEKTDVIDKKIRKMVKKPDRKLKQLIRKQLIKPVLKQQYKWVCSLYNNKKYNYITDKYPRKKDLFVYFFSYKTKYRAKKKSIERVINDISKQYSYKYKKLEKVTGERYGKKVRKLVLSRIQSSKKFQYKVMNIKGIHKYDQSTVIIDVRGKYSQKILDRLCDIYIVPLDKWGDVGLFNGYTSFGVYRGNASAMTAGRNITGDETGAYYMPESDELEKNEGTVGLYNLSPIIYNLP